MWRKFVTTTVKTLSSPGRKAETVETTTTTVYKHVDVPVPAPEKAPAASPDPPVAVTAAVAATVAPAAESEESIVIKETIVEEVSPAAEPVIVSEAPVLSPVAPSSPIVLPSALSATPPPPPTIARSVSLATIDQLSSPAWSLLYAIRHHHAVIKSHLDKCIVTANAMSQGISLDMAASAKDVQTRFNAVAALIAAHYDAEIEYLFPVLEDAAPGVTADILSKGEREREKLDSLSADLNRVLGLILDGDVKFPRRESDDFKGLVNKLRSFNLGFKFWMVGEEAAFAVILDQLDISIQEDIFTKIYLASVSSNEATLSFMMTVLSPDEKAKYLENKERILRK